MSDLVFDEQGDRLGPTHSSKSGRRYRYYISKHLMLGRAKALAAALMDDRAEGRAALLRQLVDRVTIAEGSLRIDLRRRALAQALQRAEVAVAEEDTFSLTASLHFGRRGAEARLILGGSATVATPDKTLITAVAQAHRWFEQLASGEVGSINQIAAREGVDANDVGRRIRLAFLAPGIAAAILAGTQPVELTAKRLGKLPLDWEGQRRMLGFDA